MLASITPLGERGRQMRWAVTAVAFLLAATLCGAAAGAVAGAAGSLVPISPSAALGVLAVAAALALGTDAVALAAGRSHVPGPRRQVDERWREQLRGWAYGAGYGAQLGLGVTTIVSSAATYLTLVAALLTRSPGWGALVVGVFGAIRGAPPLAASRVRHPEQLIARHRQLERWRPAVPRLACVMLGLILALALLGALS